MVNLNTKKEMILTLITNSTILKACFGYSGTIWLMSLISPQNSPMNGFIEQILNAVPSKIAGYLGIIYGLAIVSKKISEVWRSIQLDKYEVKMAKEKLSQIEIETDKQRNERA